MNKKRLAIGLEPELYNALAREAKKSGRSIAEVIRDHLRVVVLNKEKAPRVGELVEQLLLEGLPDEEVLRRLRSEILEARTTKSNIAWYRSQLRKQGKDVPSQYEAKRLWEQH